MIRFSLIAAAVVAAVFLSACSNPAGPAGQYGSIKGTITSTSGQPIAGARITVDLTLTATSNADGTYQVNNVPQATTTVPAIVEVTANGFQPQRRTDVIVQVGQPTVVNFTLAPA